MRLPVRAVIYFYIYTIYSTILYLSCYFFCNYCIFFN